MISISWECLKEITGIQGWEYYLQRGRWIQQQNGTYVYNPAMAYLPKGVKASVAAESIPQVMTLSVGSRAAQSDYVMFNWNNPTFTAEERREMLSRGDFSF